MQIIFLELGLRHLDNKIMPKRLWTRDEMILTLALYFQLPFGRLNHTTAEVKELAKLMNRTENAVALRLVNFAACDPWDLHRNFAASVPVIQKD